MKIKQKFKDIQKPKEIEKQDLESYFSKLYNNKKKSEIDLLVDELIKLSGNSRFEALRAQLLAPVSKEKDAATHDAMRKTAEAICYKLAKGQVHSMQKFNDEVNSFTIDACSPGAVTNLQKALYAMDDSLYVQKYDYIQNLANEYIRTYNLLPRGKEAYEVHINNLLLHEVSRDCHIEPAYDKGLNYRNLDVAPTQEFSKYVEFKSYINRHLEGRQGVYGLVDHITANYLANLPAPRNFGGTGRDLNEMRDTISEVAKECGLEAKDILNNSDDYKEITYKPNYLAILKAGMMRKMAQEGMIEAEFLTIEGKQIIESPDAWVSYDSRTQEYQELFSTKELKGLTIDEQNLEDYIHNALTQSSITLDTINLRDLMLKSDQARFITSVINSQEMDKISNNELLKWFEFSQKYKELNNDQILDYISKQSDEKILNKFIQLKGFDRYNFLNLNNSNGQNIFALALKNQNHMLIKYMSTLSQELNLNHQDAEGFALLHSLASQDRPKTIATLIKAGADPSIKSKYNYTPLHLAVDANQTESLRVLIKLGANQNSLDERGNTPLHDAIIGKKDDIIQSFIDSNANLEVKNSIGATPLHIAVRYKNDTRIADTLIAARANTNALDNAENTPLHYAAKSGNVKIIKTLLEAGADPTLKNSNKQTFIDVARKYCAPEIVEQIQQIYIEHTDKNPIKSNTKEIEYDVSNLDSVESFIKNASDVNVKDQEGNTLLHHLVVVHPSTQRLLNLIQDALKKGAKLAIPDKNRQTSFSKAMQQGSIDVVEKLLDHINLTHKLTEKDKESFLELVDSRSQEDINRIKKKLGIALEQEFIESRSDSEATTTSTSRTSSVSSDSDESQRQSQPISQNNLGPVKQKFIKKLEEKYKFRNAKVKAKAIEYINSTEFNNGQISSKTNSDHEQGKARKGKSRKLAELISRIRNTDNEMIQQITEQFKAYAKDDSHEVILPKRYVKKQTIQSK